MVATKKNIIISQNINIDKVANKLLEKYPQLKNSSDLSNLSQIETLLHKANDSVEQEDIKSTFAKSSACKKLLEQMQKYYESKEKSQIDSDEDISFFERMRSELKKFQGLLLIDKEISDRFRSLSNLSIQYRAIVFLEMKCSRKECYRILRKVFNVANLLAISLRLKKEYPKEKFKITDVLMSADAVGLLFNNNLIAVVEL